MALQNWGVSITFLHIGLPYAYPHGRSAVAKLATSSGQKRNMSSFLYGLLYFAQRNETKRIFKGS